MPEHVHHAAEMLELAPPPKRVVAWVRERFAGFAAGVGVTALLGGLAISMWQPRASAEARDNGVRLARPVASSDPRAGSDPKAVGANLVPAVAEKAYSVVVASFRMASEADSLATHLRALGYGASVTHAEVPERGLWHQVVAGPFADIDAARQGEARLRQIPGYSDAHVVQH